MVPHPFIYEINTWVWLDELRRARAASTVELAGVPGERVGRDRRARLRRGLADGRLGAQPGRDRDRARERGPARELPSARCPTSRPRTSSARRTASATTWSTPHLGGPDGLAAARAALAERGVGLILDFVPNHVAPDHPWTTTHPEYFVRRQRRRPRARPGLVRARRRRRARERPRPVLPGLARRRAAQRVLARPARGRGRDARARSPTQCDGVRCDMAMLMMNDVFERTWGERAGAAPGRRLLADRDRRRSRAPIPGFVFIAEAYWDLEWALQQQGFDYCYDKRLYDRLVARRRRGGARPPARPTSATSSGSSASSRTTTSRARPRRSRASRHGGGRGHADADRRAARPRGPARGPARCGCRSSSPAGPTSRPTPTLRDVLRAAARRARATASSATATGSSASAAAGRATTRGRTSSSGAGAATSPRKLVVVNLGDAPASGHVSLPWDDLRGRAWQLDDAASGEDYERSGDDLRDGLYVALDPWSWHLFDLTPLDLRRNDACRDSAPVGDRRARAGSPRRPAAPRTTSSPPTRGTSGART